MSRDLEDVFRAAGQSGARAAHDELMAFHRQMLIREFGGDAELLLHDDEGEHIEFDDEATAATVLDASIP